MMRGELGGGVGLGVRVRMVGTYLSRVRMPETVRQATRLKGSRTVTPETPPLAARASTWRGGVGVRLGERLGIRVGLEFKDGTGLRSCTVPAANTWPLTAGAFTSGFRCGRRGWSWSWGRRKAWGWGWGWDWG